MNYPFGIAAVYYEVIVGIHESKFPEHTLQTLCSVAFVELFSNDTIYIRYIVYTLSNSANIEH